MLSLSTYTFITCISLLMTIIYIVTSLHSVSAWGGGGGYLSSTASITVYIQYTCIFMYTYMYSI